MTAVMALPQRRPLTYADLQRMPDDGYRYELLDGTLLVSPAPRTVHQMVVAELYAVLRAATPSDAVALFAPLDVLLAEDTILQPDLLIARRGDLTERYLAGPPLLAVEVLSPSTQRIDRWSKRARYEAAGTPAYWVVDPDEPSLTAWQLRGSSYELVAHVVGGDAFQTSEPFAVTVVPSGLLLDASRTS